jgi:hypothetical protein
MLTKGLLEARRSSLAAPHAARVSDAPMEVRDQLGMQIVGEAVLGIQR